MLRTITPPRGAVTPIVLNRSSQFARGLIAWFSLGDRITWGSRVAVDSSTRHHNGAITGLGADNWDATQRIGSVWLSTATTTGDLITIASTGDLVFGTGAFTVNLWAKFPTVPFTAPWINNRVTSTSANWTFEIYGHELEFHNGNARLLTAGGAPEDDEWFMATFTRFGTGTNEAHIYLNGERTVTGTVASNLSSVNNFIIGHDILGNGAGWLPDLGSGANLSDVRLWNRALSRPEVSQLYRETRGGGYGSLALPTRHLWRPAVAAAAKTGKSFLLFMD